MSNYYFILLTSATCGHCVNFKKNHLANLITKLKEYSNVTYLNIEFTNNNSKELLAKYAFLNTYMNAFPNFILISKDSFDNGNSNGVVFYMYKSENGNIVRNTSVSNPTPDNLINAISSYLVKSGQPSTPSNIRQLNRLPQYVPNNNNETYRLVITNESQTLINKKIPDSLANRIMDMANKM